MAHPRLITIAAAIVTVGAGWFGSGLLPRSGSPYPGAPAMGDVSSGQTQAASSASGLRMASEDVRSLVNASSMIVEGTLIAEHVQAVSVPDADGQPGLSRTDTIRTFEVAQTYKGSSPGASTIEVVATGSLSFPAVGSIPAFDYSTDSVVAMTIGHDYVLFLNSYPDFDGRQILGFASDPGAAEVDGSELRFLVSPGLSAERLNMGLPALPASFSSAGRADLKALMNSTR